MSHGPSESPRLGDHDPEQDLRNPDTKQRYVAMVFDLIAPTYDRFTRWFSFGMDRRWKHEVLECVRANAPPGAVIVDVACGTGDLSHGIAAQGRSGIVIGVDPSSHMLERARQRIQPATRLTRWCRGDVMRLPTADRSIDLVTAGYGFRNAPDLRAALAEIARVLKPGGCLVSLDFYQPELSIWQKVYVRYLHAAGNVYGWLWHREPAAYGYIAQSVRHFVTIPKFSEILEQSGFVVELVRPKLHGGIAIHVARRKCNSLPAHVDPDQPVI